MSYIAESKKIFKTEGIRGFYRGTAIMLFKEFPGCGLFFYFKFLFDSIFKVKDE